MIRSLVLLLLLLPLAVACGDDGGADPVDASVDASGTDAGFDAGLDAFVRCPGEVLFTGDYLDWDSSDAMFKGVFDATVTDLVSSSTAQTAPNGRWELCVTSAPRVPATITQADYIPVRYLVADDVLAAGPVSTRGLTPARAATLFGGFGFAQNPNTAQVLIEVRSHPSLDPVVGAAISLMTGATPPEGSYGVDLSWTLQAATETGAAGYMFFANVPIGGGSVPISITPPVGTTCVGPIGIPLAAGQISATSFACD